MNKILTIKSEIIDRLEELGFTKFNENEKKCETRIIQSTTYVEGFSSEGEIGIIDVSHIKSSYKGQPQTLYYKIIISSGGDAVTITPKPLDDFDVFGEYITSDDEYNLKYNTSAVVVTLTRDKILDQLDTTMFGVSPQL